MEFRVSEKHVHVTLEKHRFSAMLSFAALAVSGLAGWADPRTVHERREADRVGQTVQQIFPLPGPVGTTSIGSIRAWAPDGRRAGPRLRSGYALVSF